MTIGSTVGIINAKDDDFNQTLTYVTDNPTFTIDGDRLILKGPLNHNKKPTIPILIRAVDNGKPQAFVSSIHASSIGNQYYSIFL